MKFPKVKTVTAIRKYVLHIEFTDSTEGDYDVEFLAGKGVFTSWDINDNFFKVYIDAQSGAISWPEELDIDSINAYCKIKKINVNSYLTQTYHAAY